jgi:hypothetical protein
MDSKPFFTFNMLHFEDHQTTELKKLANSSFSLEDILNTASTLKYAGAVKKILAEELLNPTEPSVRFFANQIYDGRITQAVIEQFTKIVREARSQFINERLNERLKSAWSNNTEESAELLEAKDDTSPSDTQAEDKKKGIETTEEELEGFNVVKAIAREIVDVKRIIIRDTKSYCGILLDDNNRKPICRLHFNYSQKYLGVFVDKKEERIALESVDDIFRHADKIKAVLMGYEPVTVTTA